MKRLFVFFGVSLFCFRGFSQPPVDSLNASPNPFIKRTQLHYYLNSADTTSLFVYDITGAIAVTVFTNTLKVAGGHNDSLIMDSFPDGVYFAVLKPVHSKTVTRKLIKSNTAFLGDINESGTVGVYPNPVGNLLTIDFKDATNESWIVLTNSLGQIVDHYEVHTRDAQIDMKSLGAGIYYLCIRNGDKQSFYKVVKE